MLKTSAYYDDNRFDRIKSKVINFLLENGNSTGSKLINHIPDLRQSDLDVMSKFRLIDKHFMTFDDLYYINKNLLKKITSQSKSDINTNDLIKELNSKINKTELDSVNLELDDPKNQPNTCYVM